ncbi:hypothetical protein L3Q65_45865 [Amycolatopsis sp. FU40]|uniref:hypothetical protein n=1 Tax=Amycolatopsis sp. FU40 TaxID=2914159 RepID=UPI001F32DBAD|nr:hypothetical protein [Amycolatopsis sp. FU40]UKD55102.1 hypothetical protein L3Q65_45865 [Amycolatopsis sp. FU40]
MSTQAEMAAQLMAVGGQVPVAQAEQVKGQAAQLHAALDEAVAGVVAVLGESSQLNERLRQNAEDVQGAIRAAVEQLGNAVAMLEGYRTSLQDAAAEVINR